MASKASESDLRFGLRVERVAAELFMRRQWPDRNVRLVDNAKYSSLDYAVVEDCPDGHTRMVAYIEVKARRTRHDAYPTTIVSLDKHEAGCLVKRFFRIPSYGLVVFTNSAGYFSLSEPPDRVEYIARMDRDGKGADHGHYSMSRVTLLDGFREELDALLERIEAEN